MKPVSAMLVDDAKFIRLRMIKILKPYVTKIWEVDNGFSAVNLYKALSEKEAPPDVVFMDISMHLMNGKEASEKIIEFHSEAKIIIVSAVNSEDWIKDCIRLGVQDYVVKPFTDEKLILALKSVT